jgi:hypothetical protein
VWPALCQLVYVLTTALSVSVQLWVPREDSTVFESPEARPLGITALDIAVVLHSRPGGKVRSESHRRIQFNLSYQDETVIDVAVMGLRVADTSSDEQELPLLFLTKARSMACITTPHPPGGSSLTISPEFRAHPHGPSVRVCNGQRHRRERIENQSHSPRVYIPDSRWDCLDE